MRFLVEILDKDPLENIAGTCVFNPEVVIFLCDREDRTFFKESAIYRFLRLYKLKSTPRFYYFDTSSPTEIRRALAAVARDYPGCVFDFSGGKDLILLLAGAFCIPQGMPCYYIHLRQGQCTSIQGCEKLATQYKTPNLNAEELFSLHGAAVLGSGHFDAGDLSPSFEKYISPMWEIVAQNPRAWGDFVGWLQTACGKIPATALEVELDPAHIKQQSRQAILRRLADLGMLRLETQRRMPALRFSSLLYKKTLLNQGIWLELYCYHTAKACEVFHDVRTSLLIDWDGVEGGANNTKNEVDVFLMRGVTPCFISCKMSVPSPLALSEIKLLSDKFGGKLSRTAVVSAGRIGERHQAIRTRAKDLGITLVDLDDLRAGRLGGILKSLARPT